jgi:hypothetical protein
MRQANPALLSGNPAEQNGPTRTEDSAQPEHWQAGSFGEVVDLPPAAAGAKNEFGNFVCAAQ